MSCMTGTASKGHIRAMSVQPQLAMLPSSSYIMLTPNPGFGTLADHNFAAHNAAANFSQVRRVWE